jgi:hypothetical protein
MAVSDCHEFFYGMGGFGEIRYIASIITGGSQDIGMLYAVFVFFWEVEVRKGSWVASCGICAWVQARSEFCGEGGLGADLD